MDLNENALKKLVDAFDIAKREGDKMARDSREWNHFDEIAGKILEAIQESAERFRIDELDETLTYRILNNGKHDATERAHALEEVTMLPPPYFFTKEEIRAMNSVFGGYVYEGS